MKAKYVNVPPRPKLKLTPKPKAKVIHTPPKETFLDRFMAKKKLVKASFKFTNFKLKPMPQIDALLTLIVLVLSLTLSTINLICSMGVLGLFLIIHVWINPMITMEKS